MVKKIESINTIKEEIKKLEDKRDNASISEVGNINTEINALEQKLKIVQGYWQRRVDLPVSFKVDYEFPDHRETRTIEPFRYGHGTARRDVQRHGRCHEMV